MPQTAFKHDATGHDSFDAAAGELEPRLINLMQQSEALVALMRGFFRQLDTRRSEEFRVIASYIAKAKEEIRELRPHDISHERIPTAGAELEAITRDTENATHTIMNSAEAIMGMTPADPDYKAKVDDEVMKIFEACSFQDITGQRVSKVVNVLKQIEERVGRLADSLGIDDKPAEMSEGEKRKADLLLNGPALNGPETRQDAIDAMFGEAVSFDAMPADDMPADDMAADDIAFEPEAEIMAEPAQAEVMDEVHPAEAEVEFAPVAAPQPAAPAPQPVAVKPAPQPAPVAEAESNDQSAIDALFDFTVDEAEPEPDLSKPASQDDIDALFD